MKTQNKEGYPCRNDEIPHDDTDDFNQLVFSVVILHIHYLVSFAIRNYSTCKKCNPRNFLSVFFMEMKTIGIL